MATQVQNRRGTTAEHSTFTGANGELTVDTTKRTLVVHDGATAGGRPLLREDQSNLPTSAPTTGIYNASGSLAISTGGSGRLFVNSDGKIGVGNTVASSMVGNGITIGTGTSGQASVYTAYSNSDTYGALYFADTTAGAGRYAGGIEYQHSSDALILSTASSERLRITSAGLVGVGTSSPSKRFTIVQDGADSALRIEQSGEGYNFYRNQANGFLYLEGSQQTFSGFGFRVTPTGGSTTNAVWIDNSGRLGVGTTSPGASLHVAGAIASAPTGSGLLAGINGNYGQAKLYGTTGGILDFGASGADANARLLVNNSDNALQFYTSNAGSLNERLRITSAGLVGIGTSSPAQTLHVVGRSQFQPATGTRVITLVNTSGGDGSIEVSGGATSMNYGFSTYSTSNALYIQNDGKVGIGTNPSYQLEVAGPSGDNIISLFRSGDATAANNAGGGFRATSSATATSRLAQVWLDADGANLSGGDYFFIQKNGNSGTVDFNQYSNAAMTFLTNNTERARIDSSGRLLVGTSSAFVEGVNNALTANQLSIGSSSSSIRCISDTRTVAAVNNSTVDAWVGRVASGSAYNQPMVGHFYVTVGGANCFSGVYSIVTSSLGTASATLTAVSTVTRGTSPVSSVQIANDGAGGAIKLTITYINNSGVVSGLSSNVSFVGLAG